MWLGGGLLLLFVSTGLENSVVSRERLACLQAGTFFLLACLIHPQRENTEAMAKNTKDMSIKDKRALVLRAARSQLRRMGVALDRSMPFEDVLAVLDDPGRAESDVVASQWYARASKSQLTLLRRDWNRQVAPGRRRTPSSRKSGVHTHEQTCQLMGIPGRRKERRAALCNS